MVSEGETAPDFTAPVATGDIETVTLSKALAEEAPIVLAFFPAAFTSVCTHEMNTFEDRLGDLDSAGGTLYGVSIDSPFSLDEFRDQLSLSFDLIGDTGKELIDAYDVETDFADLGIDRLAQRAVFVVDEDRTVTYAWIADNPGQEPDYDEVIAAVEDTG